MFTRNEVTSGRRLAMNHRLSGIISIEHSLFRNWTMQSGWVISRLAGFTNRASNYLHYICKRSSTSEQAIICFGVRTENKTHVCYVPLCPPFRYVRMRTQRNAWYVPLCPPFRYARDGFSSFRCIRVRTKRNDWYVPLCPPFRYVRDGFSSFRCVRMNRDSLYLEYTPSKTYFNTWFIKIKYGLDVYMTNF